MSIRIGQVEPTAAIAPHALAHGSDRTIRLYTSEAGVELCASPCVLSLEQACELRGLLDEAIQVAAHHHVKPIL